MTTELRRYDPSRDFIRVRDFLINTYGAFEKPLNWGLERWSYARYFTAPYLCKNEEITPEKSERAIGLWEGCIGVWDDDSDGIVGVVHTEHPWLGDAFIQRHPDHPHLMEEMLDFAESELVDPEKRSLRLFVYEHDAALLSLVRERGYRKSMDASDYDQEHVIGEIPGPNLPHGYTITSMAERNDLEGRGRAFGLGFNHPDPIHWVPVHVYEELQRAPDYRRDLDLYAVDRNGEIASFCIVWYDAVNRVGSLEPVGTVPHYRKQGLAREVIFEGLRRASALGARKVVVGGGNRFYESIGFKKTITCHDWVKEF
ncbi:TPA: GNAT family N-acetyltransferase [Thermoplasmata archaeon]|nr:GNAT family N-acetyltransferase [Thermoplasmata archaeon]